jgi:PAS domain S-box-containing protein
VSTSKTSQLERQLEAAQQITHMGSWEWDVATNVVTWSDELYRIYGLVPRSRTITFEFFLSRLHPDDRERVQRQVGEALGSGSRFQYPERIFRPDGSMRHLDTVGEAAKDESGKVTGLIGTCRDVTAEKRARRLQESEAKVLEMVASGAPLAETFKTLVLAIEEHSPPTIGSVLLLDESSTHLRHGAAPNLPESLSRAIDGAAIGPRAGSCGTAAFTRKAVFVTDVETDPLWEGYRELVRPHGLRACWSMPILGEADRVLGTFAFYYREPRAPTEEDCALIARMSHITGIAIERRQLEDQLRALSAHVESVREEERTGIAREIHDELGQALTAVKMDLAWIARRTSKGELGRDALLEKLEAMGQMTDEIIDVVRRISAELRPGVLDDLGLLAAVEWQAQEFQRRTGTSCVVRSALADLKLPRDLSTAVFRIFQEALTNVARHAEAQHVEVSLEREDSCLVLEVRDDGVGIAPEKAQSTGSLGLLGMRERARAHGGTATVKRGDESGTVVSLRLPL